MIADTVRAWFSHGTGTDFAHLAEEYSAEKLVREVMRQFPDMNGQASVATRLRGLKLFPRKGGSIRTVAFFYYRAYNGGSEMVMSRLSGFFARAGYRIVLLTDFPPNEADYPFPKGTERYILPDTFRLTEESRQERFECFRRALEESGADVLIYNAWLSRNLLWDLLAVHAAGVPFVAYIHGAFTCQFVQGNPDEMDQLYQITRILGLADHIVSLSRTFNHFWSQFNPSTTALLDPCSAPDAADPAVKRDPNLLLWVGRIHPEKQTLEAVRILDEVRKKIPAVRLKIVGGTDEAYRPYEAEVRQMIIARGLENAVSLEGYCEQVGKCYQEAALLLMTSAHEGFGLVIAEAKTYGLPCVAYDLPYSYFTEDGRGFYTVPQRDAKAAAEKVSRLLQDQEAMQEARKLALESAKAYSEPQLTEQWKEIFRKLEAPAGGMSSGGYERVWINALLEDAHLGFVRLENREGECRKKEAGGWLSAIFSADYYSEKYPDLKAAFGSDDLRLLQHFLEYGMSEGRQACADFNVLAYRERYDDLRQAFGEDIKAYYFHYLLHGCREGRSGK